MAEETWHGIPRKEIPWYPTINYEKCITCGKCVAFCHTGVYADEEKEGKKKTVVKNPNSCVVTCTGCDPICPVGAITHPSEDEFRKKLSELRKKPQFRLRRTK